MTPQQLWRGGRKRVRCTNKTSKDSSSHIMMRLRSRPQSLPATHAPSLHSAVITKWPVVVLLLPLTKRTTVLPLGVINTPLPSAMSSLLLHRYAPHTTFEAKQKGALQLIPKRVQAASPVMPWIPSSGQMAGVSHTAYKGQ